MSDRIKLAEAMYQRPAYAIDWMADFDPFTDANDDYAVLEWMRNQRDGDYIDARFEKALHRVSGGSIWSHQIGDYARACLKVIADTDE